MIYAGDRMWPAMDHGQRVLAAPAREADLEPGAVVIASISGALDVLRVDAKDKAGRLVLMGDADPEPVRVAAEDVLALVRLPFKRTSSLLRISRRLRIDLDEAVNGSSDSGDSDLSETVRVKYDMQAPHYAALQIEEMEAGLLERARRRLPRPGRILVAGSGSGRECFALARAGWKVTGVDFSTEMVRLATERARERDLEITFHRANLLDHEEPPASLVGVLFTYDVYSFIAHGEERVALLKKLALWLAPEGAVFLSARRVRSVYQRSILTLQWALSRRKKPVRAWGQVHTRYIAFDGRLLRAFVQVFTERRLRREARRAGFMMGPWQAGHALLVPRGRGPGLERARS